MSRPPENEWGQSGIERGAGAVGDDFLGEAEHPVGEDASGAGEKFVHQLLVQWVEIRDRVFDPVFLDEFAEGQ